MNVEVGVAVHPSRGPHLMQGQSGSSRYRFLRLVDRNGETRTNCWGAKNPRLNPAASGTQIRSWSCFGRLIRQALVTNTLTPLLPQYSLLPGLQPHTHAHTHTHATLRPVNLSETIMSDTDPETGHALPVAHASEAFSIRATRTTVALVDALPEATSTRALDTTNNNNKNDDDEESFISPSTRNAPYAACVPIEGIDDGGHNSVDPSLSQHGQRRRDEQAITVATIEEDQAATTSYPVARAAAPTPRRNNDQDEDASNRKLRLVALIIIAAIFIPVISAVAGNSRDSGVWTPSPTPYYGFDRRTPYPTPQPNYPNCNICGHGKYVTNPSYLVYVPGYSYIRCDELTRLGNTGKISPSQCGGMSSYTHNVCGCRGSVNPSPQPTPRPTRPPFILTPNPTPRPTASPRPTISPRPTVQPTPAPTPTPVLIPGGPSMPFANAPIPPSPEYPPCSVCGEGKRVTNFTNKTAPMPGESPPLSCGQFELVGFSGFIEAGFCPAMVQFTEPCGCTEV